MDSVRSYVAAACQFDSSFGQLHENLERMSARIEEVMQLERRTRLMVFPECATMGLPAATTRTPVDSNDEKDVRMLFFSQAEKVPGPTSERLGELARSYRVYIATGFVEADALLPGIIYNSSLLIGPDGEVVAVHRKVQTSGLFKAGSEIGVWNTEIGRVGLSICYDLWFPEFLRIQVFNGCELHINMTANQPIFGIGSTHVPIVRAAESGIFVVSANRCGDDRPDGGLQYMGASSIVAPLGQVVAMAGPEEETIFGEINLGEIARTRALLAPVKDIRHDLYRVVHTRESAFTDQRAHELTSAELQDNVVG